MKKKREVSYYDEYQSVSQSVTRIFISLFLFVLPLVITNAYYNITETKLVAFYLLSAAYISIQLFVFLIYMLTKGKDFLKSISFKLNFLDIAFIIFGFSYIISAIISKYSYTDVFLGVGSRYQGAATIILYVLLYFVISRTFSFSPKCLIWAGISFSVVSIIALLNGVSIDPLGFYGELSPENQSKYISTIGNINFYSAYYNLLLPVLVVGFCKAVDKKTLVLFGSFVVVGSLGMVFTASESFLLGFLISMAILLAFFMKHTNALKRFLICCGVFLFTITLYTNLYYSEFAKDLFNFEPSGLMRLLSNPIIFIVLLVLLISLFVVVIKKPDALPFTKEVYWVTLIVGFVSCFAGVILVNTVFKNVDLGPLNGYLKFSPSWGTNRGQNWSFCISEFLNAPLISKVFGFGPETYRHLTEKTNFYATKTLDQAHNEYLQYLISVGILGLVSYLSIIGGVIKKCIKKVSDNAVAMSIFCGLVAYWLQAMVNIAQPFTTPIMFIFIAVLSQLLKTEKL